MEKVLVLTCIGQVIILVFTGLALRWLGMISVVISDESHFPYNHKMTEEDVIPTKEDFYYMAKEDLIPTEENRYSFFQHSCDLDIHV